MKFSQEQLAQFDENRLRMSDARRKMNLYFWAHIGLGAIIFLMAFIAGALQSADRTAAGAGKFYTAMSAGIYQILLGLTTIVLGWIAASWRRVPSLILLGIHAVCVLLILCGFNGTMNAGNLAFSVCGIVLEILGQHLFNEMAELKEQPGYPHFNAEAAAPAEYEAPLNVTANRFRSGEMESVGAKASAALPSPAPTPAPSPAAAPLPAAASAFSSDPLAGKSAFSSSLGSNSAFASNIDNNPAFRSDGVFSNPAPLGPTPPVKLPPPVTLSDTFGSSSSTSSESTFRFPESPLRPAEASLRPAESPLRPSESQLRPAADLGLTGMAPAAPTAPVIRAAASPIQLAAMDAVPSHATQQGDVSALPTPEEVRARLAAMKRAREEHHAE